MLSPPPLPLEHRRERVFEAVKANLLLLMGAVAVAWLVELLDFFLLGGLDHLGLKPRNFAWLIGIGTLPFLHGGFGHLISNTLPFIVLGGIVLIDGRKVFLTATLFIAGVGGGALWTLGPSGTTHIGASLLIFGYLGFLVARGVIEKSAFWIIVSVAVLVLYGGMIAGVLPGDEGISWQGHLFGFVAWILAAMVMFTGSLPDPLKLE